MNQDPIYIIKKLLTEELNLNPLQVLTTELTNEYLKTNTSDLFITINLLNEIPLGCEVSFTPSLTNVIEKKILTKQAVYDINIMSKNKEAYQMKDRALVAFASTKAKQLSETYQLRLHPLFTSLNNISAIEGGGFLHRFSFTVNVAYQYTVETPVTYHDTFDTPIFSHEK